MLEPEHLLSVQCKVGEGPVWSAEENALYWVDIEQKVFYRLPFTDKGQPLEAERFEAGSMVGALALREKGGLLLATKDGLATWDSNTRKVNYFVVLEKDKPNNRCNDGKADAKGRYWIGTMSLNPDVRDPQGSLYRLDPDGSVHKMETGLTISNGLGWSPDNKLMYLTDSPKRLIYVYDFDENSGNISNRRVLIETPENGGEPDGLSVDAEGHIWSARWGGAKVYRYNPDGKLIDEVAMPVPNPASCAFGGPNLDELFITSAWSGLNDEQRRKHPLAGDLFHLKVGVKGLPVAKVAY